MALLWQKKTKGTLYEVRNAGNTRRLYTNGVFHTQYNPANPVTGHVWDLLMLPAFFYKPGEIKRVLVLGVGGGAVIQLLRHFVKPEIIIGVELDKTHIHIAKKFFNVKGSGIRLYQGDAVHWLQNYQGEKFDLIIEDLFAEEKGEPVPVVKANGVWFAEMLKHLSEQGVLVRNFIDKQELNNAAGLVHKSISKRFKSVFRFTSSYDENFVAAFLKKQVSNTELRQRLSATPGLNPSLKSSRLRYRIRRLK